MKALYLLIKPTSCTGEAVIKPNHMQRVSLSLRLHMEILQAVFETALM